MLTTSFRRPVFPACFEAINNSNRSHKAFGSLGERLLDPSFYFVVVVKISIYYCWELATFFVMTITSIQGICFINNIQIFIFVFFCSKTIRRFFHSN